MAARPSLFDLGPRARVVFAATWILAQAALIASAGRRPEHAFGFRMFSESTTAELHLSRRTRDGAVVPADHGGWWTRSRRGVRQFLSIRDYIDAPELSFYDVRMPAAYGRQAELARLVSALDDVIDRLGDEDRDTTGFLVDVALRKGGGAPTHVQLESRTRTLDAR
jgi:hypothetical protein